MVTRRRVTYGIAALLVMATVSGCGVSKSKYLAATEASKTLADQNTELQKNLETSTAKNTELEQKVTGMQASVDQLNAELEREKQANAQAQSTYESMVAKLKDDVSSGHVQIERMRDGIRVNMAQDILFKSGSAALDPAGTELLTKVAEELKGSNYEVVVIGHTDNQKIGPKLAQRFPNNWVLGGARSVTIVRLFEDAGITPARLLSVSAGETRPQADNSTPEGRNKNRRIEVRLRPVEAEDAAAR
jgi:chemotaxis protein MotB